MKVRVTVDLLSFMAERIRSGEELAAQEVSGRFKDGKPRWMLWKGNRVAVRNAKREWFEVIA
jgi:hypothetical protein